MDHRWSQACCSSTLCIDSLSVLYSLIPRPPSASYPGLPQPHSQASLSLIPRPPSASFPGLPQPHSQASLSLIQASLSLIPRPPSASFPGLPQPHSQASLSLIQASLSLIQASLSLIPRPPSASFPGLPQPHSQASLSFYSIAWRKLGSGDEAMMLCYLFLDISSNWIWELGCTRWAVAITMTVGWKVMQLLMEGTREDSPSLTNMSWQTSGYCDLVGTKLSLLQITCVCLSVYKWCRQRMLWLWRCTLFTLLLQQALPHPVHGIFSKSQHCWSVMSSLPQAINIWDWKGF